MSNSTLYPIPSGVRPSPKFEVLVDGRSSFTHLTTGPEEAEFTAGHTVSYTGFEIRGAVEIRIRHLARSIHSVIVRPLSAGVNVRLEEGEVVFSLDRPRKLSVECNGDLSDVLFVFAQSPDPEIPSPSDPDVVWFCPGVHEIGKFYPLKPATTYYLAPGSFLKGSFAGGGHKTRVTGRGILSGADYTWPGHLQEKNEKRVDLVNLRGDSMTLSGITLVDSPYYVLVAGGKGNRMHDLNIIAWYHNTDGISAGSGAVITDCFLRVADDALKPFVSDTRISGCVMWMDRAAAFQLSWNTKTNSGNSVVTDCDIIHHIPFFKQPDEWTGAVFWSWHGGTGHIHNVSFENIRIEGACVRLLDLFMERNPWSPREGGWGSFSGLQFRNIHLEKPPLYPSRLLGHDTEHAIRDFVFENLRVAGKLVERAEDLPLTTNQFVENLRFLP